jgi:hypothetical protein
MRPLASSFQPLERLIDMSYLIIILILFFVVAPIVAILPSKRQKQQMAFRQSARAAGVSVALVKIEDPDSDRDKYLSATGRPLPRDLACVAYRRPRKKVISQIPIPVPGWSVSRDKSLDNQLTWIETDTGDIDPIFLQFIESHLSDLPADVIRLDETAGLVSVYWHERSDEQGLAKLLGFLNEVVTLSPCLEKDSSSEDDSEDA